MGLSPGFVAKNDVRKLLDRNRGAAAAYSLRKLRRNFGSEGAAGPDLSLTNNGVTQVTGSSIPTGSAGSFDGSSDLVRPSSDEEFEPEDSFTVEAWIYLHNLTSLRTFASRLETGNKQGWEIQFNDSTGNEFELWLGDTGQTWNNISSTFTPNTDQWYHICATSDGTTGRLYIDGSEDNFASFSGSYDDSTEPLKVGNRAGGNAYHDGRLSLVRFWNGRALTSSEISTLYNSGNGLRLSEIESSHPALLDDLVASYEFDDAGNLGNDSFTLDGPVVRVRRGSDNVEREVGFDGDTVDTQALTDFANGGDVYVVTWYDQSGNNRDATQNTQADQPQIVSSGSVITDGGEAAIDFGEADALIYGGDAVSSITGLTLFSVTRGRDISKGSGQAAFFAGEQSSSKGVGFAVGGDFKRKPVLFIWGSTGVNASSADTTRRIYTAQWQAAGGGSSEIDLRKDQNQIIDNTQSVTTDVTTLKIGIGHNVKEDLSQGSSIVTSENVLYPSVRTDRDEIEDAINDHYSEY
jgi:hypothetical protein